MEDVEREFEEAFESMPVPAVVGTPLKTVPVVVPAIPPRPVFDEHIEALKVQVGNGKVSNEEELKRGKDLRERLSKLSAQVKSAWAEPKQAIDKLKEPLLDGEKKDLAAIGALARLLDDNAKTYLDELDRKARAEAKRIADEQAAEAKRKQDAEREAAERDRQDAAELAEAFGDTKAAEEILAAPLPEPEPLPTPRPSAPVSSGLTWAKGVRRAPKLTIKVVNPSLVKRQFCLPNLPTINQHGAKWASSIKGTPTKAQMDILAAEIGGVEVTVE